MTPRPTGALRALAIAACSVTWLGLVAALSDQRPPPPHSSDPPSAPTLPPSPVAVFRQMLDTNHAGRVQALANRSEPQRRLLQAKLNEYDGMPPQLREQRLHATEFRYYLRPLLTAPSTNRADQLALIPSTHRDLIAQRVARWDALTRETRASLLGYDRALAWLARHRLTNTNAVTPIPPSPPGLALTKLEQELSAWQNLPQDQRNDLCHQFQEFFDLPQPEKRRALKTLSPHEQQQMADTLQAFNALPPSQRALCLRSFRQFAAFSTTERSDFLRSADRWREMSAADRSHWRRLVTELPPLPPGFNSPPPLPPPPPPLNPTLAER